MNKILLLVGNLSIVISPLLLWFGPGTEQIHQKFPMTRISIILGIAGLTIALIGQHLKANSSDSTKAPTRSVAMSTVGAIIAAIVFFFLGAGAYLLGFPQ